MGEATFYGTCFQDRQGKWHFDEQIVQTTALHKRVYFMDHEYDEEVIATIIYHSDDGWCISGKNLAGEERETHIPDLSCYQVYLVTDPIHDLHA